MTTVIPARKVPVGIDAMTWATVAFDRTVLVVVHNVTTLTRLLDIVVLFDSDTRVQVVATVAQTDPFDHGVRHALDTAGIIVIPWEQATHIRFDLIISASHHGNLVDLHGPLAILSHGIGYTKNSPGARSQEPGARSQEPGARSQKPEARSQKPEARSQKPEARSQKPEARSVFGLSPQWLLYDGKPIADTLVLSHVEQLDRMRSAAPEAVGTAVVAGDPCFDRIRASLAFRSRYRALFGANASHRVVVVSSTWGRHSLLGERPAFLRELLAESDVDSTRVIAVVHPNVWHGHGPWQVRTWLADSVRAGLVIVPALEGWRAALVAADCVIGDHGAVTCYGAAIGRPVLLGAFPEDDVAKGSPVDLLGKLAPRLSSRTPMSRQVEAAINDYRPGWFGPVEELVSSCPDESPQLLRGVFYRMLGLAEPDSEPVLARVPDDGAAVPASPSATLVDADVAVSTRTVRLTRRPAGMAAADSSAGTAFHVAVGLHHPGRLLRADADVVHTRETDLVTTADEILTTILTTHPGCALAAVTAPGRCVAQTRSGNRIDVAAPSDADPAVWASAVHAWLAAGNDLSSLDDGLQVVLGHQHVELTVRTR